MNLLIKQNTDDLFDVILEGEKETKKFNTEKPTSLENISLVSLQT